MNLKGSDLTRCYGVWLIHVIEVFLLLGISSRIEHAVRLQSELPVSLGVRVRSEP